MAKPDTWNPQQYQRFAAERRQPFDDLLALVRRVPGGQAIDHLSHTTSVALANEEPFRDALGAAAPCRYGHVLESSADVVEWTKGTSLTRFKSALAPDVFDRFVDEYRTRLVEQLGDRRPFFYAFKRILFWARKA